MSFAWMPSRNRFRIIRLLARTRTSGKFWSHSHLCQKASKRLRDAGLHARTVSITLRFINFTTITRSQTLAEPSDLDSIFLHAIRDLFSRAWDGAAKLRLVGVELSSFSGGSGQMELL